MRNPEEQERFLTSGRFERQSANDRRLSMGTLTIVALLYWIFAASAFLVNFFVGFWVTLPWSYLVVSFRMHLAPTNPIVEFIASKGGGVIVYPLFCGGLNILMLFAFAKLFAGSKKTANNS